MQAAHTLTAMAETYSFLRSGLVGSVNIESQDDMIMFVIACLRVFSKESMSTAANYVKGRGRNEVTAEDMKKALMYQARMFFQKEDEVLSARIQRELELMENESESESGEEDSERSDDGLERGCEEHIVERQSGDSDEECTEDHEQGKESEESTESGEGRGSEEDPGCEFECLEHSQCESLARHVDIIADTWSLWNPDDAAQQIIKRAIDNTPIRSDED